MVEMTEEVIKMFENIDCDKTKALTWIATVTKEGVPHLTPVCFVKTLEKDKLLIGVSFIIQTAQNIKDGSKVAIANAVYPNGYMVKGPAEILTEGPHFDDFKERLLARFKGKIQPKAVLLAKIEEVYHLKPAEGKKKIA